MRQNPMKNQAPSRRNSQAGGILLIILICVALLGALTTAMIQSTRSSTTTISQDKARLAATEITTYLNSIKTAYTHLLISGCTPTTVDFSTTTYKRVNGTDIDSTPPGSTADCKIFDAAGENLHPLLFSDYLEPTYTPSLATDWKSGNFGARFISVTGAGTIENDQVLYAIGFKNEICLAVLNLLEPDGGLASVPVSDQSNAGNNSYTQGTGGSLPKNTTLSNDSAVYAYRYTSGTNYCVIGVLLKKF